MTERKDKQAVTKAWISVAAILLLGSCLKQEVVPGSGEPEGEVLAGAYTDFDFSTTRHHDVNISTLNNLSQPIDGVYVELYSQLPLDGDGQLLPDAAGKLLFSGTTNRAGDLDIKINPPASVDMIYALTYFVGLPPLTSAPLNGPSIDLVIGGADAEEQKISTGSLKNATATIPVLVNGYYTLGEWDNWGVPLYLEPENDPISNDFLDDVNSSLPERAPLPETHPQYLASSDDAGLLLVEDAEVWVTFVHEGAGWHNSLGYYTYPTENPPASVDDLRDPTIIFPDVSIHSRGLVAGNKVQLFYLDPENDTYSATFPAGTTVGWFLVAQGWSDTQNNVSSGVYTHYSDLSLNQEAEADLKKHNVLLRDETRSLLLLGFEDIRRDYSSCDHDFNDAVFYATASPATAVMPELYQPLDEGGDRDQDGISDQFDHYPDDPTKAFNNYYPAQNLFGSLVFEDLWPYLGDYDFNDLVLDYNFNQLTNGQNRVIGIESKLVVRAIGASYHNAFGISFNTAPSNVSSISGQIINKGYIQVAENGTEEGQSRAVVILFDDAFNALPYPGSGVAVNTHPDHPYVVPDTLHVEISFATPVPFSELGTPPYNPFIIIDRDRGMEVHLPNLPPTDLADMSLLGTGHDNSDAAGSKYYVSEGNLPWAINLPVSFDYMNEKAGIPAGHLMFNPWALSRGSQYKDWYEDNQNYRNQSRIYSKHKQ
jgi:LruC domain-containing protein